jgi:hypothetical protein
MLTTTFSPGMQWTVCGRVYPVRPVARRAAAVPAEVVQLVADVRHRGLVQNPAVLGVDNGEEVRSLDTRALVEAGEVEELLGRRRHGFMRRAVERSRGAVIVHGSSFDERLSQLS